MIRPDMEGEGRILFENEACVVINKRAGESSESINIEGAGFPVHRLDVPVSGCLLLAKNTESAAFLSACFARDNTESRVEKRYWAVVEIPSSPFPAEAELVHWLREDKRVNKSFAVETAPANTGISPPAFQSSGKGRRLNEKLTAKKAVLRYRVIGRGDRYLFMEIDLVTGRHHQIRAQLAAIGLHVKGDLKYGARRSERGGGIRLHAYSLAFPNPASGAEIIRVVSPPPVGIGAATRQDFDKRDPLWAAFSDAAHAALGKVLSQ